MTVQRGTGPGWPSLNRTLPIGMGRGRAPAHGYVSHAGRGSRAAVPERWLEGARTCGNLAGFVSIVLPRQAATGAKLVFVQTHNLIHGRKALSNTHFSPENTISEHLPSKDDLILHSDSTSNNSQPRACCRHSPCCVRPRTERGSVFH